MRRILVPILIAIAIGFAAGAKADPLATNRPIIFIHGTSGAWWMNKAIFKLDAKQAAGVTSEGLNTYMREKAGWENICYLQTVRGHSYVGLSRKLDNTITQWVKSKPVDPFHAKSSFGTAKQFSIDVVAYEKCGSGYGLGLLVSENGKVRDFQYFDSDKVDVNSQLLWIYSIDGAIAMAGCDECGDQSLLHYDVRADRFYWEYTGD